MSAMSPTDMFPISATTLPLFSPTNTRYGLVAFKEQFFLVFAGLDVTEPVLNGGAMALAGLKDVVVIGIVVEEVGIDIEMVEMQ